MESSPTDLTPPQIFYLMVLLLRAAAQQAGVYFSPIDAAWEQAVPDGTRSVPVATTIGDNATIRSGLECVNISDSEEEIIEPVGRDGTTEGGSGIAETPTPAGPTEPPYPPPIRSNTRRQRSSSTSFENAGAKRRRR